MIDLFDFKDYRAFVREWVEAKPKGGHGIYRRIALHLRIAPVTISQVFKGDRDLPVEAALPLAEFLNLSSLEKRYFVKLVQLSRAGTANLRQLIGDEAESLKAESLVLQNIVPSQIQLSETDLAVFHSSWIYSAVRLLTSIKGFQTQNAIAEKLNLSRETVESALSFLLSAGLCVRKGDHYERGPSRTHLPDGSPFIIPRQMSWRSVAGSRMNRILPDELFYTAPLTIAEKDIPLVRKELVKLIERVNAIVAPSSSEELACLNIDWFRVAP